MRKTAIACALISGFTLVVTGLLRLRADDEPAIPAPAQLVAKMIERLRTKNVEGLFTIAKEQLIHDKSGFDEIIRYYEAAQSSVKARHGESLGEVELISKDVIGNSFNRFIYLERFERHAIVWRFDYYRGRNGWGLTQLTFDDKTADLYKPVQDTSEPLAQAGHK